MAQKSFLLYLPRGLSLSRCHCISFRPLSECVITLTSFIMDNFKFSSLLIMFHKGLLEHRNSDATFLRSFSRTFYQSLLPPYSTSQCHRSTTALYQGTHTQTHMHITRQSPTHGCLNKVLNNIQSFLHYFILGAHSQNSSTGELGQPLLLS